MKANEGPDTMLFRANVVMNAILMGLLIGRLFTIWRKQHFSLQEQVR